MRSILDHASKILFDNDTEPLLTPGFWILPLYRELLNSARRIRPSAASERARGCTGLVKLICKENKEQRGKRKFHEGEPHPNDRGGFTQWFGSCSLINTLYVWFPASWAPMVAERLFGLSSNPGASSYPQHGQPASGLSQHQSGVHPWHQSRHEAAGSSGAMSDVDSTEVVYKIRQWSLPGAAVVPVLNVSSRVFWLELDDKALLDSYTVLQEGILCDVFSQKCSAAWQGAPGQRLTVAIMLPGRQEADDWLNFMLSQKNLWPTFTTRGTLTEEISEQTFRKERRTLQAKHLWMEVKLRWNVLADRMYTKAPTGKSREQLNALLFDKAARGSQKNPYEEKAYRGPALKAVQAWWEQCKDWMQYFKGQSAPMVLDLHGLLQAFRCKEEGARAEVEAFMEHCAKRWQTKEGTYQLKRRRLLPDVRDPPEQGNADIDMQDIWTLHGWLGGLLHGGRDALRGWEGARGVTLFHMILRIFTGRGVLFCLFAGVLFGCFFVFVCVFGLLCFSSENSAFISRFILSNFQLLTDNVSYSIGNAGNKKYPSFEEGTWVSLGRSPSTWEELLRGFWVSARCMPLSSVSRGFTKSRVGQVALRFPTNRHALDLTVSLDDQGQ